VERRASTVVCLNVDGRAAKMTACCDAQQVEGEVVHARGKEDDAAKGVWNGVTFGPSELATGLSDAVAAEAPRPCPLEPGVTPSDTRMADNDHPAAQDAGNVLEGED